MMHVIPTAIPWEEAYRIGSACFLKNLGEATWAIGIYNSDGQECIVDFRDDLIPTFFKSGVLATSVLENIGQIFNYLQCRGTPRVKDLTATLRKLFNNRDESLCEARDYKTIHWNDVPKADGWAPIDSVEFPDHTWGIVANLPEDDFLVLFEPDDPVVRTFHITRESADEAVNSLHEQCEDNSVILDRFKAVSSPPKAKEVAAKAVEVKLLAPGRCYISFDPTVSSDVETVLGIRDDWYNRRTGAGEHCLCHECVSQAHAAIGRIESRYAGALDWELTQAIKEARSWIPVR